MEISILQWNIWMGQDVRDIANFLLPLKADIVCLQEMTVGLESQIVKDGPKYLAEQLGFNYHYKTLPIESPDGLSVTLANGIFTRFPITAKSSSWINQPNSGGGYGDEYRAYVEATLDIGGHDLTVGTTHMSYTHQFESTKHKQSEADNLIKLISAQPTNYIFAGDLNALPDSYVVESISKHLQSAGPSFEQKTWTTKPFSYRGFEATELNWRLDYVFTTNDIEVISSKILSTGYSDHLPILTKMKIG